MNFIESLKGSKTYIVAVLTALYAILGFNLGHLDANTTVQLLLAAAGLAGLRGGIENAIAKVLVALESSTLPTQTTTEAVGVGLVKAEPIAVDSVSKK